VAGASLTGRGPSEEIRKYWTFDADPELAIYVDMGAALGTDLGKVLIPNIVALGKGVIPPDAQKCLGDVARSAKEVLGGKGLAIVRFDETVAKPDACLAAMDAKPFHLDGAAEAFTANGNAVVHLPGIILLGSKPTVSAALAQKTARPTPGALQLAPDQYLAFVGKPDLGMRVSGHLLQAAALMRFDVDVELPDPLATEAMTQVTKWKGEAPEFGKSIGMGAEWQRLVDALVVTHPPGHIVSVFELREPVVDQVRDVGILASVAIFGVRKYISSAKQAEARNSIGQIARDYVAYWETEANPPAKRPTKLVSLPPVPAEVPRGVKYQTKPGDWKGWDAIKFEMDAPQYYQYEVLAAKDGKSADIMARGDLNGDGKTSLFKLHITLDPGSHSLQIAPKLEETDPGE
jgi:type IV pilus assembly protein PilA